MSSESHIIGDNHLFGLLSWIMSRSPTETTSLRMRPLKRPACPAQKLLSTPERGEHIPETFRWIFRLPQPAHLLTLSASLCLAFLFYPQTISAHVGGTNPPSTLSSLIYVACFATHFGTQFWMTFASGLVLFFSLPRHVFGRVQRCLFPKYFFVNSVLSGVTLLLFLIHHPRAAQGEMRLQMWTLLVCFVSEFFARLYVVPGLLEALEERMVLEEGAGVGQEVGYHDPGPLAHCPHYNQVNRRFRKYHAVCACANILSMACSTLHLYFLSTKLRAALT
ncbi:transmembrane protein 205-like [Uloborus diversus]|uniref:transmembrane protein 205-like n=1 Tax=Uloborus diversus TaxID=327109 RepID=UPI0024092288|nr:transmembrane protein 205-like [Uloborus diversus]